jgi:hypothetical protein
MFICDDDFNVNSVSFCKLENREDLKIKIYILSDYFDLDTFNIINEIYKIDFEMFDYDLRYALSE